ncbi:MAG: glucose-6-phosphate isomerase [Halieaceae bacterium]|nr:glucose-6-phosphate isomerase [Halieaceae bacterium]
MTARELLTQLPAFEALQQQASKLNKRSVIELFDQDPQRAETFTVEAAGLHLDYSKHLIDGDTLASLCALADQAAVYSDIAALFGGSHVNNTEDRPALHTLLRASRGGTLQKRFADVCAAREQMKAVADTLNRGDRAGFSGKTITDVVSIGIGGSDLGPRLVTEALQPYQGIVRCHYVANVDPADLEQTLATLHPDSTLFIVCSKSFLTEETLANALSARQWLLQAGASTADIDLHFLAVTSNLQAAQSFGISPENCLPLWDWVGGRYSVWSAVGLSCAIALGWENFRAFLAGAERMDEHFRQSRDSNNMPLLMSLLEIWYCDFLGAKNHVILPYDHALRLLPDFLQQLTMESNGKRVSAAGVTLDYTTAPALWGSAGTIGQHSFHQLLHQGQLLCPTDFILPLSTHTGKAEQHCQLVANCLAQSRAMMVGRSLEDARSVLLARGMTEEKADGLAPHLVIPGNRPNSIITLPALTPATLGALLALYEHRTYCSGMLWGINPFDQWGVELGKEISADVLERLSGKEGTAMDPATERLIKAWRHTRQ